ncbi:MAG: response regulator [Heteroscytonema crispum UTEX LB 1556]
MQNAEQSKYQITDKLTTLRQWVFDREAGMVFQLNDGSIQACNSAAESILGLTAQQLVGCTSVEPPWQAIHADGSVFPGETHPAMVALRTGKPCLNVVMGLYKPSGELIWLFLDSQPLFKITGNSPYAVVTTFYDVTEKLRASIGDNQINEQPQTEEDSHRVKILVVDDDVDTLELLILILEDCGASVTIAASATEALATLSQSLPDLIICDIGMPDMDGYALMREIRSMPPERGGQIPAIAITAYGKQEVGELAVNADFQDYLIKPFEPQELLSKLNIFVKKTYIVFTG